MTDSERRFMLYGGFITASALFIYADIEYMSAQTNLRKVMNQYHPKINRVTHEIHLQTQGLTEEQIV